MNSRNKGKRGELQCAAIFRQYGWEAHRTQQFCGKAGDADVHTNLPLHLESKWTERLNLTDAMAQAKRDTTWKLPVVVSKKNHCEPLITFPLHLFLEAVAPNVDWETVERYLRLMGALR